MVLYYFVFHGRICPNFQLCFYVVILPCFKSSLHSLENSPLPNVSLLNMAFQTLSSNLLLLSHFFTLSVAKVFNFLKFQLLLNSSMDPVFGMCFIPNTISFFSHCVTEVVHFINVILMFPVQF